MGKIRQILIKLIGNGVKFTDNGTVKLSLEHRQSCYKFIINDTGIGISLRQQRNIYNAFSRQKQSQQGVGLGLVIAKNQIELMGGTLQLDSTPGDGSRFSFTLILPKAKGPVHQRTIRGRKVTQLITKINGNGKQQTIRVLIIDRNQQTQDVLQHMLSDVGITVTQARDGEEALRLLAPLADDQLPGLVFYDIDVPLQTDSEQLARMRSKFGAKNMQFVVLSAAGIQNQIKLYVDNNKDDDFQNFIAKPYRFEAIYELVHRLLGVQFEYQEHPSVKTQPAIDGYDIPEALRAELKQAAGDYEIAKLETNLAQLASLNPAGEQLSTHLGQYLRHYNMEGLLDELDKVSRH
jgi:CheY-like chemotaxis protein